MDKLNNLDALIIATSHEEFKTINIEEFDKMFKDKKVLIDVKGILNKDECIKNKYTYWRL